MNVSELGRADDHNEAPEPDGSCRSWWASKGPDARYHSCSRTDDHIYCVCECGQIRRTATTNV